MEDFKTDLFSDTLKKKKNYFQIPNIKILLKMQSLKTQLARWQ